MDNEIISDKDIIKDEENVKIRKKALNYDRTQLIQVYLKTSGLTNYYFINYINEAYNCFIYGCPRSSIIMSGEALQRALLDLTKTLVTNGKLRLKEADVDVIMNENIDKTIYLNDIILYLKSTGIYDESLMENIHIVRLLRNCATHSELPIIDIWDPEDGRRTELEMIEMLNQRVLDNNNHLQKIKETGYKVLLGAKDIPFFHFNIEDYNCSLKEINPEEKIAAIQFFMVIKILKKVFNNTDNIIIFPQS